MRYIIAALAALVTFAASAVPVVLTWTNPTQNTNGTPLAGPIASRRIQWTGDCPGFGFVAAANNIVLQGSTPTHTLDVTPGTRCFRVAVTVDGVESGWSNVFTKTVVEPAPTPNAPTNLTVVEDTTAFVIVKSRDRVAMVPVGTVAPGTACDATQQVMGKFVVPRSAVTFVSSVQDEVIFGTCG